jgi:hypothetical protein
MPRVNLQSTSLYAVTYPQQSAFLEVEFRSGVRYRYLGVSAQVYEELLTAESKGGYFNQHIRTRFAYIKIDLAHSGARFRLDQER